MYNLTKTEETLLLSLNTPSKIQDFLDSIAFNHEENGETCMSPRRVLKERKAHCVEGALLASTCLMLNRQKPTILSLRVTDNDYDHVVTVYKKEGYFGAISMTNHAVLGFRDPIYKSIRELALSYFHEYFLQQTGEKTLRGYSRLINLKRFGTSWVTSEENLFYIPQDIYNRPHTPIIPKGFENVLRKADSLYCEVSSFSREDFLKK